MFFLEKQKSKFFLSYEKIEVKVRRLESIKLANYGKQVVCFTNNLIEDVQKSVNVFDDSPMVKMSGKNLKNVVLPANNIQLIGKVTVSSFSGDYIQNFVENNL